MPPFPAVPFPNPDFDLANGFGRMIHSLSRDCSRALQLLSLALLAEEKGLGGLNSGREMQDLASLDVILNELEARKEALRRGIAQDTSEIQGLQSMLELSRKQAEDLHTLHNGLPKHLPGDNSSMHAPAHHLQGTISQSDMLAPTAIGCQLGARCSLVPTLPLVTKAELEGIPKVTRGRIDLEHLNASLSEIQIMLSKKYALLSRPSKKLSDKLKRQKESYMEHMVPEQESTPFLTEAEIRSCPAVVHKGEASSRNIMSCLRHLQRLKMVRAGGVSTYCATGF
jgi:hypothetical protein